MGLLSDTRAYLQRVQAGDTTLLAERSTIDRAPLRRLILEAVARDDARAPEQNLSLPLRQRLLAGGDALIFELVQQVSDLSGIFNSEDLAAVAAAALARLLDDYFFGDGTDMTWANSLEGVHKPLVDGACKAAWSRFEERWKFDLPSPRLYALELGLVQVAHGKPKLAPLGEIFLRLGGADATRWPVAIELLTAVDRDDPWRGSESFAKHMLQQRVVTVDATTLIIGPDWPWHNPALPRWASMGLLTKQNWQPDERPDEPTGGESFTLTDFGARILQELTREPDAPIKSFARALLEDASEVTLDVMPSRSSGAAASVVRHTRMIAHELRNRLVPVRIFYDQLWKRLPRDEVRVALHRQHTKIVEGLDQALRFVTETAHAVSSFPDEAVFVVASALHDACDTVAAGTEVQIAREIAGGAEDIHLQGPRPRLLMALVNILRNAVQAGGPDVKVAASLSRAEGYIAVLMLEDSGPGIPASARDKLFVSGHSSHQRGTGHGLALVREVVEQDFSGSVHYEESPLGGARFVLRFPIPSEAT